MTVSNVDKKSVASEQPVRLCNYTDVYYNDVITDDLPLMEATASLEQIRQFGLRAGDVLITKDSETPEDIGVPAFIQQSIQGGLCGYHLAIVRARPGRLVPKYLFWALQASGARAQLSSSATGVTRFGLRAGSIRDLEIYAPSTESQLRVAAFLDTETARIDASVATRQLWIELLNERRKAVASAIATARDTGGLRIGSRIDPLGTVPEYWVAARNKNILSEVTDLSSSGDEELLTVSHITGVTRRSEKDVTMFMANALEGYKRCLPGDLVINTMWAWMGAFGVAREAGIVSPGYAVYRFDRRRAIPEYFELLYRTPAYVCEMTRHSKGVWTSRLRLYPEAFLALPVPVPPLEEQQEIVERFHQATAQLDRLTLMGLTSVALLKERRQALITAAVTGELDVTKGAA